MSDNRQYYYLRLKENFFDDDAMLVLEGMPDGYLYSNILLKMMLRSLKNGGRLAINNVIPYNSQMLAKVTHHQVGTVEKALEVFQKLGFIEILDNGAIYIMNIQNFIGKTTTEADRQREYDRKIALEKKSVGNLEEILDISTPELEIEKDIDTDIEKEKNKKGKRTKVLNVEEIISDHLFSSQMSDKILEWVKYKTEKRCSYKEQGLKSLLTVIDNNIKTYGEQKVMNVIDESMAANWQGICFDKLKKQESKYQSESDRIANRISEVDTWV